MSYSQEELVELGLGIAKGEFKKFLRNSIFSLLFKKIRYIIE
ncbi:MAG: hypothetical protein ACPLOV_02915 [Thermovenabulum sp.]